MIRAGEDGPQVPSKQGTRRCKPSTSAELPIGSDHAVVVATLPPIHKDPFDRLLVAQAMGEGITLLTADALAQAMLFHCKAHESSVFRPGSSQNAHQSCALMRP